MQNNNSDRLRTMMLHIRRSIAQELGTLEKMRAELLAPEFLQRFNALEPAAKLDVLLALVMSQQRMMDEIARARMQIVREIESQYGLRPIQTAAQRARQERRRKPAVLQSR